MSSEPPTPVARDDEEEANQLAAAIALSLAEAQAREAVEGNSGFEIGGATENDLPAPAPAAPALSARPRAKPRAKPKARPQPRRFYVVTSVPERDVARLGIHHSQWNCVGVPRNTLAGSGWSLRVFEFEVEALAHWEDCRGEEVAPRFREP